MMNTIEEVCRFILYHAYEEAEKSGINTDRITNMWLQKTLYYVYSDFHKINADELFPCKFEAWEYGPVYPEAYLMYCEYKRKALPKPDIQPLLRCTEKEQAILLNIIHNCVALETHKLIKQAKLEKPWLSASKSGKEVGIGVKIRKSDFH